MTFKEASTSAISWGLMGGVDQTKQTKKSGKTMIHKATINPEKILPCDSGPLKSYTISRCEYQNNFLQRTCTIIRDGMYV